MKKKKDKLQNLYLLESQESVAEMSTGKVDDFFSDIPLASGVDIEELKKGDDDPMFVVVRVLEETISENGNAWTLEAMESVCTQILEKTPDGYLGHIPEDKRSSLFPEPQTLWIGAKIVSDPETGKKSLLAKGYVLPDAKLRSYLKKTRATNKKVSVSVYGQASRTFNRLKKHYDIKAFSLESIDWARPGSQGVRNANLLRITQETMKREEIIASITVDELKEYNEDVIQEITESVKNEVVQEMDTDLKAGKEAKKALGEITKELGENPLVSVAEMRGELDSVSGRLAETVVDTELKSRVASESARKLVRKMTIQEMSNVNLTDEEVTSAKESGITLSEMKAQKAVDTVLETEEAKAVIQEMTKTKNVAAPKPDVSPEKERKYTTVS